MNKTVFLGLLVILLAFGFNGCDNGNGNGNGNGNEEFTVTFDLDGGNISGNTASVPIKVKSGKTIASLPNPQKVDNDFGGWFSQKNGLGDEFKNTTVVISDLSVYANWTPILLSPLEGIWLYIEEGEWGSFWKFTENIFLMGSIRHDVNVSQIDENFNNFLDGAAKGTFTYSDTEITFNVMAYWDGEWFFESELDWSFENPRIIEYSITNNVLTLVGDGYVMEDQGLVSGDFIKQ